MEHGPEAARAFLSQCQYLTNHWLLQHGMSIGIGDTVADASTMGAINDTINKVRLIPNMLLDVWMSTGHGVVLYICDNMTSWAWHLLLDVLLTTQMMAHRG